MTPISAQGDVLYNNPGNWQLSGDTSSQNSPNQVYEGDSTFFDFTVMDLDPLGKPMVAQLSYQLNWPGPGNGDPEDDIYSTVLDTGDGYHGLVPPGVTSVKFRLTVDTLADWPLEDPPDSGRWRYDITFNAWYNMNVIPPTGAPSDSFTIQEWVQVNDIPEPATLLLLGLGGLVLRKLKVQKSF
jgi:hypothetical protein